MDLREIRRRVQIIRLLISNFLQSLMTSCLLDLDILISILPPITLKSVFIPKGNRLCLTPICNN
jgi:hypothetical protein